MPAIHIPDPLPPAITPPRTVIEFLVDQDLEEYGEHRPGRPHLALGPARRRARADQPHGLVAVRRRRAAIGRHPRRRKHRRRAAALPAHPMARAQPGQVHLLAVHLCPRR